MYGSNLAQRQTKLILGWYHSAQYQEWSISVQVTRNEQFIL